MIARLYTPVFLLHRFIIVLLFVPSLNINLSSALKTAITFEGIFLLYIVIIRPFATIRHNIMKIGCEVILFILYVLLYNYKDSDFTTEIESTFLALIMLSSMLPSAISICTFTIGLFIAIISPEDFTVDKHENQPLQNNNMNNGKESVLQKILNFKKKESKVQSLDNSQINDNSKIEDNSQININSPMKEEMKKNFGKIFNLDRKVEEEKEANINNENFDETRFISLKPQVDPKMFPGIIKFS